MTPRPFRRMVSSVLRSIGSRCVALGIQLEGGAQEPAHFEPALSTPEPVPATQPPAPEPPPAPTFAERYGLTDEEVAIVERNREIKDIYAGRRGFVIGTGPSIARQNLSLLADEVTITMSGFWKHSILSEWQPDFYCFGDTTFFDGSPHMGGYFRKLREKVPDSRYIGLLSGYKTAREHALLDMDKSYFALFDGELRNYEGMDIALDSGIPAVQGTSQLAIYTAIWAGCNPIYLLGLDHDWLSYNEYDRHFYDGFAGLDTHPVVLREIVDRQDKGYVTSLQPIWHLWQGYMNLKRIADARGIKIYNATRGGFLDVFDRVDYESLFPADPVKAS